MVIAHKSARLRESGLLNAGAPQILRCAQDDSEGLCHPERRIYQVLMGNHQEKGTWRKVINPCYNA